MFREAGEYFPGHHFRLYHGWLCFLDLSVALVVYALSGSWLLSAFAAVYFPLGLDVVWWVKRWLDFHYRYAVSGIVVFLGRDASEEFYNEKNAWHLQSDWDNYGGGKLLFGTYLWWWTFGVLSFVPLGLSVTYS